MAEVIFFIAAIGAIAGAIGTVSLRNPFYSVLALVCHLLALAALFLLLRAEFVAAAQVIVYAGAVMVLYVFVVAYVGEADTVPLSPHGGANLRWVSVLFAGVLLVELCIAILGSGIAALGEEGGNWFQEFGTPQQIGALFLTKFLLAFELASLLLLIAAVGAVILARRRGGMEGGPEVISVADVFRAPEPTGELPEGQTATMAEAAGTAEHVP
jgi:NADH:ubiquinone oxidoreductase subunit 6 (subunit J)